MVEFHPPAEKNAAAIKNAKPAIIAKIREIFRPEIERSPNPLMQAPMSALAAAKNPIPWITAAAVFSACKSAPKKNIDSIPILFPSLTRGDSRQDQRTDSNG
jgi:hypothetical protein